MVLAQPEPKRRPTAADASKWSKSVGGPRTTAEQTAKAAATTDVVDEVGYIIGACPNAV